MSFGEAYDNAPVDAVEEIGDVRFQEEGLAAPVTSDRAGETGYAAHSVMGAAAGNAGITIPDEPPVETFCDRIVDEVMHDSVAELRGPHLPDFRVCDHESNAAADFVIAASEIVVQRDEVPFEIGLETQLVYRVALRLPAIEIGIEDGLKRQAGLHGH